MAKIHVNVDDIKSIIKSYTIVNETFLLKSFIGDDKQKICKFNLNGKECAIDIFITSKYVNIIPKGKNVDESNLMIRYIVDKGYSATKAPEQFSMSCKEETLSLLEQHIIEELEGIITINKSNNLYRVTGYNGDTVTIHFYPQKQKILLQGRPYQAYSVILSFFASLPEYNIEDIVSMSILGKASNNKIADVRQEMKRRLGDGYNYLDDALLKSISGSISMINQLRDAEDYTGCLTGAFKALEGYLKKILSRQFGYVLQKSNTFSMFHKKNGHSDVDLDSKIPKDSKESLKSLYSMYSNKRNVYLHSTIDPALTRIINNRSEAKDLLYDILELLNDSYIILFRKEN